MGAQPDDGMTLVYDGECPFCSNYVRLVKLRESVGQLRLVDARSGGPIVDEIVRAGYDLDEGMVLKIGDRFLHGVDSIHALALMSGPSGWFNRLNACVFRSPRLAKVLYPVLRAGRNATLRVLGRSKLSGHQQA